MLVVTAQPLGILEAKPLLSRVLIVGCQRHQTGLHIGVLGSYDRDYIPSNFTCLTLISLQKVDHVVASNFAG